MLIIVIYFCIVREGDYFMPACFYTVLQLFSVYEIKRVSFFLFCKLHSDFTLTQNPPSTLKLFRDCTSGSPPSQNVCF